MRSSFVALLTDFGTEDGYVGAMKGRLLDLAPHIHVVDISHEIEPYNIRQAAFCLNNSYKHFPEKTIFVVVVDPGVGTPRKGVIVETSQHIFIGPDNGVFSFVCRSEGYRAFEIKMDSLGEDIAPTFHGRDVFSRVAAWLANGRRMTNNVNPLSQLSTFLKPMQQISDREYRLEIFHVDHFGNLILNLHQDDCLKLEAIADPGIRYKKLELKGVRQTFGDVDEGAFLLTWDSSGFLQVALNKGRAAKKLDAVVGDAVTLFG
ncbi:MAG: SAM hydrolase/SAM-dependent halogenase family protein [Calditrichia bacterium]